MEEAAGLAHDPFALDRPVTGRVRGSLSPSAQPPEKVCASEITDAAKRTDVPLGSAGVSGHLSECTKKRIRSGEGPTLAA